MIKDCLTNTNNYNNISENLKIGLEWLKNTDLNSLKDGKYSIKEDLVFASIQTYETKLDAKYEAHRNYIDIQHLINGEEKIGITHIKNCTSCIKYDKEKDIEFFDTNTQEEFVNLSGDEFVILFPNDAHKPSIMTDKQMRVKKVVVKVSAN